MLVGDEARVRRLLPPDARHVEVVHAPDVISFHDEPAKAARTKTESSLVVGLKLVHEGGADAFVSAANTGAVVAGSIFYVRRSPASSGRPSAPSCRPSPAPSPSSTSAPTPSAVPSTCASSPSWARPSPAR